jgi:hypothetical protein
LQRRKLLKKQNQRLKISLYLKQSLTEKIAAVLFIGVMRMSLLTGESLQVLRAGREKRQKEVIIIYKLIITI